MDEAKRRAERDRQLHDAMLLQLADDGQVIAGGYAALRAVMLPPDAAPHDVKAFRWAYYAGAQHLFVTLQHIMSANEEPTKADMRRIEKISDELAAWSEELRAHLPTRA